MGGDPGFSYNEVTYDQYKSLEYNLDHNPDINDPDVELWFSGYSAERRWHGRRPRNPLRRRWFHPSRRPDANPERTRQIPAPPRPDQRRRAVRQPVNQGHRDREQGAAAVARRPGAERQLPQRLLRRGTRRDPRNFYAIIVEADLSLPFFVHVLKIAGPVILQTIPIFGGFLGPLAPLASPGLPDSTRSCRCSPD
jgi:hypothetical protein